MVFTMNQLWKLIEIPTFEDKRGVLSVIENNKDIPFSIQRVYYIYGSQMKTVRGYHAHKKLQQVLIAVNGSIDVKLHDGCNEETITLKNPFSGLLVKSPVWRTMRAFSSDAILLVLASLPYAKSDYIRSYSEFKSYINIVNIDGKNHEKKQL